MGFDDSTETLRKRSEQLVDIIGSLVETRNMESRGHIRRMKAFTGLLATEIMKAYPEYNLDRETVAIISATSAFHDMGKIAIPDAILFKPARLTLEEFDVMKTHTTMGCEMLDKMGDIWDENYKKTAYEICRHHHEKFDGHGYPDGLKGDEIPISAQIVSVADIYDALVCVRVYKDAYSPEQAYRMIITGECGAFNPKLMECFRNCAEQFAIIARRSREAEQA